MGIRVHDVKGIPIISLGMKGLLDVEINTNGPKADIHSSLATLIENPAWRLISALSSLIDRRGKILIDDWSSEVTEFTSEEMEYVSKEEFDPISFKQNYGLTKLIHENDPELMKKSIVGGATCNITGLLSGYTGQGSEDDSSQ